jgi:hypothetical protein
LDWSYDFIGLSQEERATGAARDRVCPRCGSAAEQHEYCQTCGLHLFEQAELPTRQQWEQGGQTTQQPASTRDLGLGSGLYAAAGQVGRTGRGASVRQLLIVALAATTVLGVSAWIFFGPVDTPIDIAKEDDTQMTPTDRVSTGGSDPPEQRCIELWNGSSNARQSAQVVGPYARNAGDVYVTVGFASDFPDRCLITVGVPSADRAIQYLEGGQSGFTESPYGVANLSVDSVSQLPPSAKQWNARALSDGSIEPGTP